MRAQKLYCCVRDATMSWMSRADMRPPVPFPPKFCQNPVPLLDVAGLYISGAGMPIEYEQKALECLRLARVMSDNTNKALFRQKSAALFRTGRLKAPTENRPIWRTHEFYRTAGLWLIGALGALAVIWYFLSLASQPKVKSTNPRIITVEAGTGPRVIRVDEDRPKNSTGPRVIRVDEDRPKNSTGPRVIRVDEDRPKNSTGPRVIRVDEDR